MNILNPELQLAEEFIQHTSCNIFLTGKAGTGKTIFLHAIKKKNHKRLVVTAPTGVAAINAGTLSSSPAFFLLIPTQSWSKVKTNKNDSLKFARPLESNMLKRVWVHSPENRAHRQILRTRWQIINHRSDVMRQIKKILLLTGMDRNFQRTLNTKVLFDPFRLCRAFWLE